MVFLVKHKLWIVTGIVIFILAVSILLHRLIHVLLTTIMSICNRNLSLTSDCRSDFQRTLGIYSRSREVECMYDEEDCQVSEFSELGVGIWERALCKRP